MNEQEGEGEDWVSNITQRQILLRIFNTAQVFTNSYWTEVPYQEEVIVLK